MKRRHAFWAATAATAIAAATLIGTNQLSTQQALNILAGNTDAPYTKFSTQQAANLMVNNMAGNANRDSLVGMICFVYDDVQRVQWDSVKVFQPTKAGKGTYPASYTWNFKAGLSIEAQNVLDGDTVSTLSPANTRTLYNRGWDMGTVGWDEKGSLWNGNTGKVATGNFTSTDQFEAMFVQARATATLDSMGISSKPRWISWSNSGGTAYQKAIASRLGYEFGFESAQSASGVGVRPNASWPLYQFAGGDTAMTGSYVAAVPGWTSDRFEILQCLGENNNSIQTKRAIWRAIQTKGLCVVILHSPIAWKTALTASAADTLGYGGNLNCMSRVMWFCNKYVQAGLLRVVTPSEAADWFYNRPISPGANWAFANFRDVDRSVHVAPTTQYKQDQWLSFTGSSSLVSAPTPKALLGNPTSGGYGGKNYCKMNWATATRAVWARGSARPWNQNNTDLWVIPPKGGGWTAHFEIFAIQDTTVASGTTANGDSLGVLFTVAKFDYWNAYSTGATASIWPMIQSAGKDLYVPGGSATGPFSTSNFFDSGANQFGNTFTFAYTNNINTRSGTRHAEWLHTVTDWEYPGDADILFISVWHGTNNASGEIRLSNPHLSFFKNSPPAGQN